MFRIRGTLYGPPRQRSPRASFAAASNFAAAERDGNVVIDLNIDDNIMDGDHGRCHDCEYPLPDLIHNPTARMHGLTEFLAIAVAILSLCTAAHLVYQPRRRRPAVLRRGGASRQQRTRDLLGQIRAARASAPPRWGRGRSSAQNLMRSHQFSTELADLTV